MSRPKPIHYQPPIEGSCRQQNRNEHFNSLSSSTKYTLHVYAKKDRVVHWDLSDKNADTKEIERVSSGCSRTDSGRALHPIHQLCERSSRNVACQSSSYLQRASILIQSNCCFNDLQSHYIRPNFPKNGKLLSKPKIQALVREYMDERAPSTLPGFVNARANGKDAIANKIL